MMAPTDRVGAARELIAAAGRRRIDVLSLLPERRLLAVERTLRTCDAGAIAVCGPARMQATVAAVASGHDLPLALIPFGEEDLLARDLGLDGRGLELALAAALEGAERRVDLAEVNGLVFVNQVVIGLAGEPPGPLEFERLRATDAEAPLRRSWEGASGTRRASVVISNNPVRFDVAGRPRRQRLDAGELGVALLSRLRRSERRQPDTLLTEQRHRLELPADAPVLASVDGCPRLLRPPLRFRMLPGALRVRVPSAPVARPTVLVALA